MKGALASLLVAFAAVFSAVAQSDGPRSSRTEGISAFQAMAQVLHNSRCLVCHSTGDYPRQGNDLHRHLMNVRRGPDGDGSAPVRCSTCHQDHNLSGAHMPPGAPDWRLPAPGNPMIWEGLSARQLCQLIADPKRNGGRGAKAIEAHMHTPLVLWAWHPGDGRKPVSISENKFLSEVHIWTSAGLPCP